MFEASGPNVDEVNALLKARLHVFLVCLRSYAVACLALAFFGIAATTRELWEKAAAQSGMQRTLAVRRHKVASKPVLVHIANTFAARHERVAAFLQARPVEKLKIVGSLAECRSAKQHPVMINELSDVFQLVLCPHCFKFSELSTNPVMIPKREQHATQFS